jgi:hypothetical protein
MKYFCSFCNTVLREVIDSQYPKLTTYLCYTCGYSIDQTMFEDKALLTAYERLYSKFKNTLKPTELSRFQPKVNTNNNSREDTSTS